MRILKQVACETLLRVASTMIWEERGRDGGRGSEGSLLKEYVCVGREVINQEEEAAMRAGPNEETV